MGRINGGHCDVECGTIQVVKVKRESKYDTDRVTVPCLMIHLAGLANSSEISSRSGLFLILNYEPMSSAANIMGVLLLS